MLPSLRGPARFAAGPATLLFVLLARGGWAADATAWRVSQADVRVVCPLTVGGSFEATTPSLAGKLELEAQHPASFAGELVVDLRTLDTGIGLRNDHLRETYLEVEKGAGFATAALSELRLGDVDAASFQGRTRFTGTLRLHGATKPVAGDAVVRREGATIRVEASFPVTLADYAIAEPRYLGVGVKREVQVKVSLVATPEEAPAGETQ